MNLQTLACTKSLARVAFLVLAIVALMGFCAMAQETTGSITGTVTDASGAVVPNAKIEITGPALIRPVVVTTDSNGNYTAGSVPSGLFTVAASAQGFSTLRKGDVTVTLGRAARIDFKMEVGRLTESVVVSADAVMVDTSTSQSAVSVDKGFFDLLPKGRSFYDLVNIAPGARNEGKGGGYEVDGASGSENTFYLDGMELTNIQNGTLSTQNRIPIEAVQQVQIKNGVMEAQYGGAMGGVINAVVRSGTNQWHGEAGFYFDNNSMRARDRATLRLSPLDENKAEYIQQGMSQFPLDSFTTWNPIFNVGGPLWKNKLFLFSAYMPTKTDRDRPVQFQDGNKGTYNRRDTQQYLANKLDYAPFSKLRVGTSWVWNPNKQTGVLPTWQGTDSYDSPWGDLGNRTAGNIIAGSVDYLATSRLVISFRGGYSYTNYNNMYATPSTTAIYYSGTSTTTPPADLRAPNGWVTSPVAATKWDTYIRKNFAADASYVFNWHGQHNIKGGWQANLLSNSVATSSYANGYYRYYWGSTPYTCITSACTGKVNGTYGYYRYRLLGTYGDASSNNHGLYLQDNWRVSKKLTLNLGVRTEREYLPSFSTGGATAAPPIEFDWLKKMSPRLGFAYDLKGDGKQRIYGSFGVFYDVMKYEMPRGSFGGDVWQEWYYALDDPNLVKTLGGIPTDPYKLPGKFFEFVNWRIPSNDPTNFLMDPNLMPMAQRMFDIGYDYSISPTLVASARYTNRRLLHTIEDTGYIDPDAGETYLITNPGFGISADQKWWTEKMGNGVPATYKAERHYDAVEFRLDKRFSKSYQFSASYTWSRLYGNYSGLASSDENGRTSPNVNRYFDMPWVGYDQTGHIANGPLATDRPNTFKFFGMYSLKSKVGMTTFSPIISWYSGTPITSEANVVSTTPMFVYGRGDLGRTPMFFNGDMNVTHDFTPSKAHEALKIRFELSIFNVFNSGTVTNRFTQIVHSSDGYLLFNNADGSTNYGAVFKGFDTKALMKEQNDRVDPQYGLANGFQGPRNLRIQLSFFF